MAPKVKKPSAKVTPSHALLAAWKRGALGSHPLVPEHRFHPDRRWRFDFALPDLRVAIEIEGRGRHHEVDGFRRDCEKYNYAAVLGWAVFRFPATDMNSRNEWGESRLEEFIDLVSEFCCQNRKTPT